MVDEVRQTHPPARPVHNVTSHDSYLLQPRPLVVTHCAGTPTPWALSCRLARADCTGYDPLESFFALLGISIVTACHAPKKGVGT